MHEHVMRKRLLELADKGARLTAPELDHLEQCGECLGVYAESILQVARERVKDKRKKSSASGVWK